jgi:hypothetical protein
MRSEGIKVSWEKSSSGLSNSEFSHSLDPLETFEEPESGRSSASSSRYRGQRLVALTIAGAERCMGSMNNARKIAAMSLLTRGAISTRHSRGQPPPRRSRRTGRPNASGMRRWDGRVLNTKVEQSMRAVPPLLTRNCLGDVDPE